MDKLIDRDLCASCGNQLPYGMMCPSCAIQKSHLACHAKEPLGDGIGRLELIDWMGDDLTIVNAARVSYQKASRKFSERDRKLLSYLLKNRHGSPFEHVVMQFRVTAPIFVVRQWQRHRIASYNEQSGRWSEFEAEFYVPNAEDVGNYEAMLEYSDAWIEGYARYKRLLDMGQPKELARIVLPLSLYTSFYFTVNVRSLMNFISLRFDDHAQSQIRAYGEALDELFEDLLPTTHKAFVKAGRVAP